MNQGKNQQTQSDAKKLKTYENNLRERNSLKTASNQENGQAQEQSMGMVREYNGPSSPSTKPKK